MIFQSEPGARGGYQLRGKEESMKQLAAGIALVLMFATVQFVRADDAEMFRKLISDYYDAWNTMKAENAAKFYAPDADLVFYDAAPMQYRGFKEYQEGAQKYFFDTTTACKLIPNSDLRVTRKGDVAWTTLTFHISATLKDGKQMELDCRQTSIWEKRKGGWVIVHEHISVPLAMP
jgi:uncharacterized protein (TIGR02246 family)